jgi:tripartite-type tricarboxylate transporter receptor subunit TctC
MTTKLPRRKFLHLAAGAAALPFASHVARAQMYPSRPVRMVIGFPAGSVGDIYARLIGRLLSERLGQAFIIENRVGAGGTIAADAVAHSAPDGYTLLLSGTNDAYNSSIYANLKYDYMRDFVPIASIAYSPQVLEVNPSVPAKSVPEFIAYVRANPGKVNYASAGIGTPAHLLRRTVQAIDRRKHGSCPLSRRCARSCRLSRGTSAGDDRFPAFVH